MPILDTRAARTSILGRLRDAAPPVVPATPDLGAYLNGPYGRGSLGERIDPSVLLPEFERAAHGWRAEVLRADTATWPGARWDGRHRR